MQPAPKQSTPWQQRAFISVQETAEILARSPAWVRELIRCGDLDGVKYSPGAPTVVAVPSVLRFIADAKHSTLRSNDQTGSHLTLISSNDAMI